MNPPTIAAILACALAAGVLAWLRRDLSTPDLPRAAWWLAVAAFLLAAAAWLVAIVTPLPVVVAWLASLPAILIAIAPRRFARLLVRRPRPPTALRRPRDGARPMRATPGPRAGAARTRRQRWHPGDLRLAVTLIEETLAYQSIDGVSQDRLRARVKRLDRFLVPDSSELLALVAADVEARLSPMREDPEVTSGRRRRIQGLLAHLDPAI